MECEINTEQQSELSGAEEPAEPAEPAELEKQVKIFISMQ
jgi:hypothetical protein